MTESTKTKPRDLELDHLDKAELEKLLRDLELSEESAEREYRNMLDRFNKLTSWQDRQASSFALKS